MYSKRWFETFSDIINIHDLCSMLHISKNKAYDLIHSGQVPAKRIGRIYRIRKIDVINYISN